MIIKIIKNFRIFDHFTQEAHRASTDHKRGAPGKINVGDPTPNGEGWQRLIFRGLDRRGVTAIIRATTQGHHG